MATSDFWESRNVHGLLEQLTELVGVEEVMVQHVVADHVDAIRPHELLADGVGLTSR